jgi:uncharacterized protein
MTGLRLLNLLALLSSCLVAAQLPDARPVEAARTFKSPVIDSLIDQLRANFLSADLGTLFSNCLPNTLDTTIYSFSNKSADDIDAFVITGDISAMWLRDSVSSCFCKAPSASRHGQKTKTKTCVGHY